MKVGVFFQADVLTSASGFCQWYSGSTPNCSPSGTPERRGVNNIKLAEIGGVGYLTMFPVPQSPRPFTVDSRGAGTTSPDFFTFGFGTLGNRTLRFTSVADLTACQISPNTAYFDLPVTVLKCKPVFDATNGPHPRVAPGVVQLYVPPEMSGATSTLQAAVADWNANLSGTGVSFSVVTSSCGTGPACITLGVSELPGCGNSSWGGESGGVMTGNLGLTLRDGWELFPPEGLQRTFAHELGHFLGLGNYLPACGVNAAVMQDQFNCAATPSTAVTVNDALPVQNSVYGTAPKTSCGF